MKRKAPSGAPGRRRRSAARKRAATAETRRKTADLLRALFEASAHAIVALARDDTVTLWNPAAERVFGWTAGEVVGRRIPIVPEEDRAASSELSRKVLAGEAFTGVETRRRRKDGSLIEIRLSGAPLYDNRHVASGAVVMLEDITAEKRVEAENALLAAAQTEHTAELEALYDLSARLRAALTPQEMYPVVVDRAVALLRAAGGRLGVLNPEHTWLTRGYASGVTGNLTGTGIPVAGSISERVIQTGLPYVTGDFAATPYAGRHPTYRKIGPLIIVAVRSEEEAIGTLAVQRDREAPPFADHEIRLLRALAEMGGTAIRRARLYETLQDAYVEMVLALARTVDLRDTYTAGHSERLAEWAVAVARDLGADEDAAQTIRWGALLHDIGKIGVPDQILRKPARLTDLEWTVMRRHPEIGEDILRSAKRLHEVSRIVRSHQERWDGAGYPDGLHGEEIPLGARIVAVADAYSAMTDARPYKPSRPHDEAVVELRRAAGTQFDPSVVEAFCRMIVRGATPETPAGAGSSDTPRSEPPRG